MPGGGLRFEQRRFLLQQMSVDKRMRERDVYYSFFKSPIDVNTERGLVTEIFEEYNATVWKLWGVSLQPVRWENDVERKEARRRFPACPGAWHGA